ACTIR
ncbi:fatty acid hydroxylase superfamily protein, partial [Vibrio parahaemolyticus EKP-008]